MAANRESQWNKVLMSDALFIELGAQGVEWGLPDKDGFYTPAVYGPNRYVQALEMIADMTPIERQDIHTVIATVLGGYPCPEWTDAEPLPPGHPDHSCMYLPNPCKSCAKGA